VDGQEVRAARAIEKAHAGDTISVALRPEIITLNGASSEANRLQGTIEDVTFLGSIVRIRVRIQDTLIYFDTFNNPHLSLPQRGQPVTISFPREAVLVLGANPDGKS
jgi:putative spermidine/putrescine transport system ATP-binding protein